MKSLNELVRNIDPELFEAITQGDEKEVNEIARENILELTKLCSARKVEETIREIRKGQQFLQAFKESLTQEELKIYYAGMIAGNVIAISGIEEEFEMEEAARKLCKTCNHFLPIIKILSENQYTYHDDLAKKLEISSQELREIMDIVEESSQKYVVSAEIATSSYYSLSDAGQRFVSRISQR